VGLKLDRVGAEGVGLEQLGAGLHVLLVDLPHLVGLREIHLVVAAVDVDPLGVEHRAHGAVRHHHALLNLVDE